MLRKRTRERLTDFGAGPDGKVTYLGEHVRYVGTVPLRRVVGQLWVATAVAAVATLVPGFLPVKGLSGTLVVTAAFVMQFVALVMVVWGLARLSAQGPRMRLYVREETADALPRRALAGLVAAGVAAVGEVVLLAMGAVPLAAYEVVFLAAEVIVALALLALRAACGQFAWEEEPAQKPRKRKSPKPAAADKGDKGTAAAAKDARGEKDLPPADSAR